ncbi:MAG: response regulator [Solirubrobacterales bacterium]
MAGEPVLVVDDHPTNLKLVQTLLEAEGYDVRTAADAEQARSALAEFQPRMILMDIQLPGVDGLELTRELKSQDRHRDIRVIAVSSYAMAADEQRALAAGCDGFIAKPINTRSLPGTLRAALAEEVA